MRCFYRPVGWLLFLVLLSWAVKVNAQANLAIYTDNLVNGFQNWSWATVNLATSSPVHSGNDAISVTDSTNYQALYLEHSDFNTTPYAGLGFWINGGTSGGQKVQVWGLLDGTNQVAYSLGTLPASTWQQFTIPLSSLGVANKANFSGIWIQGSVATAQPTFYVDDIQLVAAPAPALTHLGIDATQNHPVGGRALVWREHGHLGQLSGQFSNASVASGSGLPGTALAGRLNVRRLSLGLRHEWKRPVHEPRHQSRRPGLYHRQLRFRQQQ
ncbi:MAG: hypothetical protein ACLPYZ_07280 [Limisphaerales bacterium]